MKRIISFLILILIGFNSYSQAPVNVTFSVDMSLYPANFTNVEFYRGGQFYNMTNTGNNVYEFNTLVPGFQASSYTYKFSVDGNVETFIGSESCVVITPVDTVRSINLLTTNPSLVCFETCDTCQSTVLGCIDSTATNYNANANVDDGSCEYNVTFVLDMRQINEIYITPEVNGTFNSWCGNCAQMTDNNNDSIWEITIPLTYGVYEFKYSADDWNIQESLYEFDNCVVGSSPYINRELIVNGNLILDTVCWSRCFDCDTERNFYNVTFELDMSNFTNAYTNPEVNGTFNNWCGNCWMLDPQGNNIYSKSFNIDTSIHAFKFSVDNWNFDESLDSSLNCVLPEFDSTGTLTYVNRVLNLVSDTVISVCWESCDPCNNLVYGCTNVFACNYDPSATIDDGSCDTIFGCMDSLANNYNSLATCPDTCIFAQVIYGCTDTLACNYSSVANTDDGSCLLLYGCMDTLAYNFDSLANCNDTSLCIYQYNVTFQLDLRGQTNLNFTTPEVNGVFNSWCGNCAQMSDPNNDSIWEITIPILEGTGPVPGVPGWEFKFSADNWNIQETLFSGDPCTYTAFGFTNRYLNVTKDTILDPVCWGSCISCLGPQSSYNVTFRLDMSQFSNFNIPEVNGEFNNWCGNCWQMNDIDGDNIWEFTTLVDTSLQEYKFSADNWNVQESLDSSLSCVLSTIDSTNNLFVNRYLHIFSDTILDIVCWNKCDTCSFSSLQTWDCGVDGCFDSGDGLGEYIDSLSCVIDCNLNYNYETTDDIISIFPNPFNQKLSVTSQKIFDKILIYNSLGEKIFENKNPDLSIEIDIKSNNSGIFLLELHQKDLIFRKKIIKY